MSDQPNERQFRECIKFSMSSFQVNLTDPQKVWKVYAEQQNQANVTQSVSLWKPYIAYYSIVLQIMTI